MRASTCPPALALASFLALLVGCGDKTADDTSAPEATDADGDGFDATVDCDDADAAVNPDATEVCDGVDNDCDDLVDDADDSLDTASASAWFADLDADGFGDADAAVLACEQPAGTVTDDADCDDTDAAVNPDAAEVCNDGVDDDCDGAADDADSDVDTSTFTGWYLDADGDGYGNPATAVAACAAPAWSVADDTDCDDADPAVNPAATEVCNDGLDDDCDGVDDDADGDVDAATYAAWYADSDSDGYGDPASSTVSCAAPSGSVADATDCDDTDGDVNPGEDEVCNGGVDDDCDGLADDADGSVDARTFRTWYADTDSDGYGDPASSTASCDAPSGSVSDSTDCDDASSAVYPGATEGCDGVDYDCDGAIDNDADGDGYSDQACGGDDCDDSDAAIFPEASGECAAGADCLDLLAAGYSTDGPYTIDPDGSGVGDDPMEVYCDMTTDGGGWTLCASLTRGYVPSEMLYNADAYAFQARLNGDDDYVFETDAPARTTAMWDAAEELNYGQFCRAMGTGVTETWIQTKSWNYANNSLASAKNRAYDVTKEGVFSGNLFLQWFTNSSAARTFTHLSGDTLSVSSNNNGYGGPYTTASVSWGGSSGYPRTQSTNPWGDVDSSVNCTGCTYHGSTYASVPYGQTTILNDMSHSFWSGISNVRYGWADCTANGNCSYHESGAGVWLFWVR